MSRPSVEIQADGEAMLALDPDTLDPKMNYRFVQDRPTNVTRRTLQGYVIVSRKEHGVRLIVDDFSAGSTEDQIRVGDSILMMCSKDLYRERRRKNDLTARSRLSASEQQFKDASQRKGVRPLTGNEGEKK